MNIHVENPVWSRVDDIRALRKFFTYSYVTWTRSGRNVFYRSMVGNTGYFFTGLIPLIYDDFDMHKHGHTSIDVTYGYKRKCGTFEVPIQIGKYTLEPHQSEMVRAALQHSRGILQAPTAAGKTIAFAAMLKAWNGSALILQRSTDLMYQTQKVLQEVLGVFVGIVGDQKLDIQNTTVAMVPSLKNWSTEDIRNHFPVDTVIIDEAHHAQAKTYVKILKALRCERRIGVTATPKEKKEDIDSYYKITGLIGPILYRATVHDAPKRIAKPMLQMLNYGNPGHIPFMWPDCYTHGIVRNIQRNQKVIGIARYYARRDKSVLIVVKRIEHGELLQETYPAAEFVQGKDDAETRQAVKTLLNGRNHMAIATNIFSEGVDIPKLDVIVNAAGGLSKTATIQQAGRVLRRTEGKEVGLIVDFWDPYNKYLRKHSNQRYAQYREVLDAQLVEE